MPGQSPREGLDLPIDGPATDPNEASGRPVCSASARFAAPALNASEVERIAVEVSEDVSVGARFERGVSAQPGGNSSRPGSVALALLLERARLPSGMRVDRIELAFRRRPVAPSELHRNIVKPARREAAIEMAHPRNDHARDRNADVGARLVENEEVEAGAPDRLDAGRHLLARIETAERRGAAGPPDVPAGVR